MAIKVSAINNMTSAKDSAILAFASDYLFSEGVVDLNANDLKVTEQSPNAMAVDVEKGYIYVQNDAWVQGSNQPKYYRVEIDTKTGKSLTPNASANDWIVAICIKVDVGTSTPGASGELAGTIEAVYGTPAASPVAPAIPNHHTVIAYVQYNSGHAVITNARITDRRVQSKIDYSKIFPFPITEGMLVNGKIVTSIPTSNNLKVEIKTLAGNDPSATDPVYAQIDGTLRTITAALSITMNGGTTNRFNAGHAMFTAKELDYFPYLFWDSTNSLVRMLVSRLPYALKYGDFSSTSTSEKYAELSGGSPASTVRVVNIGRYPAILTFSTPNYNWTLPATSYIVQKPIHYSRWLPYQPVYSGQGGLTFTSVTTGKAQFRIIDDVMWIRFNISGTIGGTLSGAPAMTLPFDADDDPSVHIGSGYNGQSGYLGGMQPSPGPGSTLGFFKVSGGNYSAAGIQLTGCIGIKITPTP